MKLKIFILILLAFSIYAKPSFDNGVFYLFKTNKHYLRPDVRMFWDYSKYMGIKYPYSGVNLRRGRFALKANLYKNWNAEFDIDVSGNEVSIKDMWFSRNINANSFIKIGNFKPPFSLEELTSSLIIPFMERSLANSFSPGRRPQIGFTYWNNYVFSSFSFFMQELDDYSTKEGDDSIGFALRTTTNYSINDFLVHLGFNFLIENTEDEQGEIKIKAYPESKTAKLRYLNTGKIKDVDYNSLFDFELALSYKFLKLESEFTLNKIFRNSLDNITFYGFYVQVSGFLTGDKRAYSKKEGEFSAITPKKDLGSLELLFRFSKLDLNDSNSSITGGSSNQYTLGLTYYPKKNFRFLINYSYVDNSKNADGDGELLPESDSGNDFHIIQGRFIANF